MFDYEKYHIRTDARSALDNASAWLNKNARAHVLIEGHCDERGTNEYNLALGEKNANAAYKYLLARGIPSSKMSVISYGEDKPSVRTVQKSAGNRTGHGRARLFVIFNFLYISVRGSI